MKRVRHLTGRDAGLCVAKVHMAAAATITRQIREDRARRKGHPADQCGTRAMYAIDGDPLCLNHAGQRALKILEEQNARDPVPAHASGTEEARTDGPRDREPAGDRPVQKEARGAEAPRPPHGAEG